MKTQLETTAERIISVLKENNVTIQRYDSVTTESIYLKLDYGVAFSIRISNHKGKKHLKYRYNVFLEGKTQYDPIAHRYYYSKDDVNMMLSNILTERHQKISKYGVTNYKEFMLNNKQAHSSDKRGFWKQAQLVHIGLI